MKKFYSIIVAAMVSIGAYAAKDIVPSDQVLSNYYNEGQVAVCIYVSPEIDFNDIVFTGTYNNWSDNAANCARFRPVEDFAGWYVVAVEAEAEPDPEKGIQGKPVVLDENNNFNWNYQVGAATMVRGGVQSVQGSYAGEIDLINYGVDAPNVYTVDAWKQNPPIEPKQPVVLCVKLPADTPETGVLVMGSFDGGLDGIEMELLFTGYHLARFKARGNDQFAIKYSATVNKYIYDANAGKSWNSFEEFWVDDTWKGDKVKSIELDLSGANCSWADPAGIKNVTLTKKEQKKVMIDGTLYIINDNKMFTAQGVRVR